MTTSGIKEKSRNGASRLREFLYGRSWLEIGIVILLVALFVLTWVDRGRGAAVIFVWGGFWGAIALMIFEAGDAAREKREVTHRLRPTQHGMVVMPEVKVDPADVEIGNMPSPPSQVSLDKLKEAMLEEGAISSAEDSYQAILPAAQDLWDDTGFAEPMTEAVASAFDYAVDQTMNP